MSDPSWRGSEGPEVTSEPGPRPAGTGEGQQGGRAFPHSPRIRARPPSRQDSGRAARASPRRSSPPRRASCGPHSRGRPQTPRGLKGRVGEGGRGPSSRTAGWVNRGTYVESGGGASHSPERPPVPPRGSLLLFLPHKWLCRVARARTTRASKGATTKEPPSLGKMSTPSTLVC